MRSKFGSKTKTTLATATGSLSMLTGKAVVAPGPHPPALDSGDIKCGMAVDGRLLVGRAVRQGQ